MHGGPSQHDLFEYKPLLIRDDNKPLPFAKPDVQFNETGNLFKSPWEFRQHGQSGHWVSELLPNLAGVADDLCFVRSMYGTNAAHGGAILAMNTGSDRFVRPSMGSWISYGLGTENENLPAFNDHLPVVPARRRAELLGRVPPRRLQRHRHRQHAE